MIPAARLALLAGATALAGAALVAAQDAAPASAAEQGQMLVSLDGVHFTPAPTGSLFPADVALVPGSTVDGRFWVRNDSELDATLSVAVSGATATTVELMDALALAAGTGGPATPVPLAAAVSCAPLLQGETLDAGETAEVRVALTMSPGAGNAGQGATADADLRVSLTDARAPLTAPDCSAVESVDLTGSSTPPGDETPVAVASTTTAGGTASELTTGERADAAPVPALPTLPFADQSALSPVVGLAAAGGALLLILLLVLRKRRTDAQS